MNGKVICKVIFVRTPIHAVRGLCSHKLLVSMVSGRFLHGKELLDWTIIPLGNSRENIIEGCGYYNSVVTIVPGFTGKELVPFFVTHTHTVLYQAVAGTLEIRR